MISSDLYCHFRSIAMVFGGSKEGEKEYLGKGRI